MPGTPPIGKDNSAPARTHKTLERTSSPINCYDNVFQERIAANRAIDARIEAKMLKDEPIRRAMVNWKINYLTAELMAVLKPEEQIELAEILRFRLQRLLHNYLLAILQSKK